tara:strand:- start:142 stop:285 length:144 start_codon:yes stop_codon:yes gene_type:complete
MEEENKEIELGDCNCGKRTAIYNRLMDEFECESCAIMRRAEENKQLI